MKGVVYEGDAASCSVIIICEKGPILLFGGVRWRDDCGIGVR